MASKEVLLWRGLCCSTEAQEGEEAEEEEEEEGGRGKSRGEAGGPLGLSFSIMVVESQGAKECTSVSLYMCVRVCNMLCTTCSLSYRAPLTKSFPYSP